MTFHNPTESVVRNAMRKHYIHFYLYRWWYRMTKRGSQSRIAFITVFFIFFLTGFYNNIFLPETETSDIVNWVCAVYYLILIAWGILATLDYVFQRARLDKAFDTTNEILRHNREAMISRATFNEIITHLGYSHA